MDLKHRHVIIAGFGPVGRMVADRLKSAQLQITVIDLNEQTIERQKRLQRRTVHGDATDPQVLCNAGINSADALILAIPDEKATLQACRVARRLRREIFIEARANHLSTAMLCTQAGADHVVIEEVVTAEAMGQAVVKKLLNNRD